MPRHDREESNMTAYPILATTSYKTGVTIDTPKRATHGMIERLTCILAVSISEFLLVNALLVMDGSND